MLWYVICCCKKTVCIFFPCILKLNLTFFKIAPSWKDFNEIWLLEQPLEAFLLNCTRELKAGYDSLFGWTEVCIKSPPPQWIRSFLWRDTSPRLRTIRAVLCLPGRAWRPSSLPSGSDWCSLFEWFLLWVFFFELLFLHRLCLSLWLHSPSYRFSSWLRTECTSASYFSCQFGVTSYLLLVPISFYIASAWQ